MKIGYIGLGIMGRPCALNLLKAGYAVGVWARNAQQVIQLRAAGATVYESPAMLAQSVDVLFTNLPDTPDVEEVLLVKAGILRPECSGLIVVDMSTISPLGARRIADALANYDIEFLDAPVSGGEVGAINGTLSFMIGGNADTVAKVTPILNSLGQTIVHVGANGAGSVAKACNQIAIAITIEAVAEAFALADACGVDKAKVRMALLGGFAHSRVLEVHGQRMIEKNYTPGFKAHLHLKDMRIVNDTARALGIQLPFAEQTTQDLENLVAHGGGELDSSAIAQTYSPKVQT